MYVVCTLVPIYDGRDAYRGAAIFPVADLPEVNTLEVAELMAQRLSDEMGGGLPDEVTIAVYQRADSQLLPVSVVEVDDDFEPIPF